jgi:hypothetical protein
MQKNRADGFWEWLFLAACLCFVVGIFLDGWAHNHIPELESFFTPWHAVLYTGYALTAIVLLAWTWHRKAIPAGHGLSLFGSLLFFLGGIGDMLWHIVFGVEADIEALLSPTHIVLAIGAALVMSGGARHFWATHEQKDATKFLSALPLTLSLTFTLGVLMFMSQFSHYTNPDFVGARPTTSALVFYKQGLPILGTLLFCTLLTGTLAIALRRSKLPLGSITMMMVIMISGFGFMISGTELIAAAFFAGLIGDGLLHITDKRYSRYQLRLVSTLLPLFYTLFSILILKKTQGIWLSIHMWTGLVVLSGIAGFLVSLVAWPTPVKAKP